MSPQLLEAQHLETVSGEDTVGIGQGFQEPVNPVVALRALYELLEDYSPMWYSEKAHDMATAALGHSSAY
jgi:hypothetical protein